jgi:tetratricopeptide (TPR) repeat protein
MQRYLTAVLLVVLYAFPAVAEECTVQTYGSLVTEAKSADAGRDWATSVESYKRMLGECALFINAADLVKIYDALSVALMMNENYSAAIDTAKKCLELDNRYNSCMMTASRSYEKLGDVDLAISYARSTVVVGGYDDYSAAVVILAKEFLKRQGKALE